MKTEFLRIKTTPAELLLGATTNMRNQYVTYNPEGDIELNASNSVMYGGFKGGTLMSLMICEAQHEDDGGLTGRIVHFTSNVDVVDEKAFVEFVANDDNDFLFIYILDLTMDTVPRAVEMGFVETFGSVYHASRKMGVGSFAKYVWKELRNLLWR